MKQNLDSKNDIFKFHPNTLTMSVRVHPRGTPHGFETNPSEFRSHEDL